MTRSRESHVVSGLRRKRGQIAGYVVEHERKAREWRTALAQLDATLKQFDPDLDPEQIPSRRSHHRPKYFPGNDLAWFCLDAIRKADGEPISVIESRDQAVEIGGVPDRAHPCLSLRQRIINYLTDKEKAREIGRIGPMHNAQWRLPDSNVNSATTSTE